MRNCSTTIIRVPRLIRQNEGEIVSFADSLSKHYRIMCNAILARGGGGGGGGGINQPPKA